jgi:hypothetical protein
MAKEGWLTIRDIPVVADGAYFKTLVEFFRVHTTCPSCHGVGYVVKRSNNASRVEAANVRYAGIPELEELKANGNIVLGDVLRQILESKCLGRKVCPICSGARFIKKGDRRGEVKKGKQSVK